jgi:hypothetical protein
VSIDPGRGGSLIAAHAQGSCRHQPGWGRRRHWHRSGGGRSPGPVALPREWGLSVSRARPALGPAVSKIARPGEVQRPASRAQAVREPAVPETRTTSAGIRVASRAAVAREPAGSIASLPARVAEERAKIPEGTVGRRGCAASRHHGILFYSIRNLTRVRAGRSVSFATGTIFAAVL